MSGKIAVMLPLTIGESVCVLRTRRHWSAPELARRSGLDLAMVRRIEADDPDIQISMLSAVCEALGYWFHIALVDKPAPQRQPAADKEGDPS